MLKPVFVPKARRETAVERARLEKEEKEKEQKRNIEKVFDYCYYRCGCNHEVLVLIISFPYRTTYSTRV